MKRQYRVRYTLQGEVITSYYITDAEDHEISHERPKVAIFPITSTHGEEVQRKTVADLCHVLNGNLKVVITKKGLSYNEDRRLRKLEEARNEEKFLDQHDVSLTDPMLEAKKLIKSVSKRTSSPSLLQRLFK